MTQQFPKIVAHPSAEIVGQGSTVGRALPAIASLGGQCPPYEERVRSGTPVSSVRQGTWEFIRGTGFQPVFSIPKHGLETRVTEIFSNSRGGPYGGRRGFSFTEILFAVMILGIGFIMVAAVFPVAIKQTEETVEETTGASVAKSGASYMARIANDDFLQGAGAGAGPPYAAVNFPPTGGKLVPYTGPSQVFPAFSDGTPFPTSGAPPQPATTPFWQLLSGNLILSTDTRFAWVPFYSRAGTVVQPDAVAQTASNFQAPAPFAQVTIVAVQCRNTPTFTSADLLGSGSSVPNLQGRALTAVFTNNHGTLPDTIAFSPDTTLPNATSPSASPIEPDYTSAVAEGTYVIIGDDQTLPLEQLSLITQTNGAPPLANVSINGYVFRVGNRTSGNTWELMPGGDMQNGRYSPTTTVSQPSNAMPTAPLQTSTLPSGTASPVVRVFIVGRGYADPTSLSPIITAGPAMDIGTFSSFIGIK